MKTNPVTFAILLAIAAGNFSTMLCAADTKSSLNATDEKFVKQAGAAGMAEVKIATLGTQKAERADVKNFATMLVTDHTKANAELTALAEAKKVELSAVINPDSAGMFKDLEKESGKDFDKAFLDHLESSHKESISTFEDAEKNAADGEVKSFASATLPVLRTHLNKIKEMAAK